MSLPLDHATGAPHPSSRPPQTLPLEIPTALKTAGKVTKLIAAVLFAIVALGSLAIGITMAPFSTPTGAAAIAFSTALFAAAGCLVYSGVSSNHSLASRNVVDHTHTLDLF